MANRSGAAAKKEAAPEAVDRLVVTARMVTVKMTTGDLRSMLAGDVVDPEKVSEESIEHLRSLGFVAHGEV